MFAVPSQFNGAKPFAGEIEETRFRFGQGDGTGCVELVPCVTTTVHNDVGFHWGALANSTRVALQYLSILQTKQTDLCCGQRRMSSYHDHVCEFAGAPNRFFCSFGARYRAIP